MLEGVDRTSGPEINLETEYLATSEEAMELVIEDRRIVNGNTLSVTTWESCAAETKIDDRLRQASLTAKQLTKFHGLV